SCRSRRPRRSGSRRDPPPAPLVAADALPERVPAGPVLGQRPAPLVALRPVGRLLRERSLGRFDTVPEPVFAAHEQPGAVAALVGIAVVDRLLDPALAVLDLRAAVDTARGVTRVREVDQVIAYEQDRHAGRRERIPPEVPQRVVPDPIAPDPDV